MGQISDFDLGSILSTMDISTILGLGIGIILAVIIIGLVVQGIFLLLGAKIAGIENPTLGEAIIGIVLSGIVTVIVGLFLGRLSIFWLIGFIMDVIIISKVFDTSIFKAIIAMIFSFVGMIIFALALGIFIAVII